MAESVTFDGFKELADTLRGLPEALAKKELNLAVRAAAKVMQDEAQRLAPKDTGVLARNIVIRRVKRANGAWDHHISRYILGVKSRLLSGKKRAKLTEYERIQLRKREPYYWHFVEFGTSHSPKVSYLRGAFEATKAAAVVKMRDRLRKRLAYEAQRSLKRMARRDGMTGESLS